MGKGGRGGNFTWSTTWKKKGLLTELRGGGLLSPVHRGGQEPVCGVKTKPQSFLDEIVPFKKRTNTFRKEKSWKGTNTRTRQNKRGVSFGTVPGRENRHYWYKLRHNSEGGGKQTGSFQSGKDYLYKTQSGEWP